MPLQLNEAEDEYAADGAAGARAQLAEQLKAAQLCVERERRARQRRVGLGRGCSTRPSGSPRLEAMCEPLGDLAKSRQDIAALSAQSLLQHGPLANIVESNVCDMSASTAGSGPSDKAKASVCGAEADEERLFCAARLRLRRWQKGRGGAGHERAGASRR